MIATRRSVLIFNCEFFLPGFEPDPTADLGFHSMTACCFDVFRYFDPIAADFANHRLCPGYCIAALAFNQPTQFSGHTPPAPQHRFSQCQNSPNTTILSIHTPRRYFGRAPDRSTSETRAHFITSHTRVMKFSKKKENNSQSYPSSLMPGPCAS